MAETQCDTLVHCNTTKHMYYIAGWSSLHAFKTPYPLYIHMDVVIVAIYLLISVWSCIDVSCSGTLCIPKHCTY